MDTLDSPQANLPARLPASSIRMSSQGASVPQESSAPAPSAQVNSRLLYRALVRNWWQILLAWLLLSTPLVYLVYRYVEPSYQAYALLRIESNNAELFGTNFWVHEPGGTQPTYLQTQLTTIVSNPVLDGALFNPDSPIPNLPMIKDSKDPKTDLRKKLDVQIIPNQHWIRVALESTDPMEASLIVNAVVDAFTERTKSFGTATAKILKADYEKYLKDLKKEIDEKKERLTALAKKGNVEYQRPMLMLQPNENEQFSQPPVDTLSLDQYKLAKNEFMQTEFQLVELEARLAAKQAEMQQFDTAGDRDTQLVNEQINKQLKEQIADEFRRDPDVASLISQIKSTKEQLEHNRGIAKKDFDPSLFAAQKQLKRLNDEYSELWKSKSEQIKQRLLVPTGATGSSAGETLAELKTKIEGLKIKRAKYSELLSKFDAEKQLSQVDTLNSSFHQADLVQLYGMYDMVNKKLRQLDFSKDKSAIYIEETDRAEVPKAPYNNKRVKYMAILPVGVLFAVLGIFLLLEVRSERVGDPDLLSNRVRSEVYALPPLPTTQSARKLSGPSVDDQIDRFIQRLDHLRFAVCASHHDAELGRCLLVTSAISGEGKTTLAAQLAARCGNAGISTLLIDADLRRAGLCTLLEIPEGPGLSDLLEKDKAKIEDVLIPVQGGTFYLLTAGTPVHDPSGVFQGRGLAMLIAELRKRYEMIIIDSPPVLPVPDALILGRWADGALLAARFEVSRSPQVERARRQLDNAGIPLLGTVINGMRFSDAYYGRYTYNRQRPSQPDPSSAL